MKHKQSKPNTLLVFQFESPGDRDHFLDLLVDGEVEEGMQLDPTEYKNQTRYTVIMPAEEE